MRKKCFKCKKIKEIKYFYKHFAMADGYLGKCKSCTKKDVNKRYYDPANRDKIIAYEKKRWLDPARRKKMAIYLINRRRNHPGVNRAMKKVNNAVRDGRLKKKPCEVCGDLKSEGHHKDYRKYLDVKWLCRKHHKIEHGRIPF